MGLAGAAVISRTSHFPVNRKSRRGLQIVATENSDGVERLQPRRALRMRARLRKMETLDHRPVVGLFDSNDFRATVGTLSENIAEPHTHLGALHLRLLLTASP